MSTSLQALEVDVDTRLARVWAQVWQADTIDRSVFASALRMAYAEGYVDALREDTAGRRCSLASAHGYATI